MMASCTFDVQLLSNSHFIATLGTLLLLFSSAIPPFSPLDLLRFKIFGAFTIFCEGQLSQKNIGDGGWYGSGGSVRIGVVVPGRAYLKSFMVVLGFSGSTADRRTRRSKVKEEQEGKAIGEGFYYFALL